jgi:hypothetical protein
MDRNNLSSHSRWSGVILDKEWWAGWRWGFILAASLMALFWAVSLSEARPPLLVGIGCQGASGPLYGNEESAFPQCMDIHRVD